MSEGEGFVLFPFSNFFFFSPPVQNVLPTLNVHEKTRNKSEIAVLDNAHLKGQTFCYFMLKPDLSKREDNAVLFSACYSSLLILITSAET